MLKIFDFLIKFFHSLSMEFYFIILTKLYRHIDRAMQVFLIKNYRSIINWMNYGIKIDKVFIF